VPTLVLMQRGCRQGPAGGRLSILAPTTVAFTLVGPSNLPRRKPSVINGRLDQLSREVSRQFTRARGRHIEWGLVATVHAREGQWGLVATVHAREGQAHRVGVTIKSFAETPGVPPAIVVEGWRKAGLPEE
jgi:hypothetical protein